MTIIEGRKSNDKGRGILVDDDGKLIISPETTGITIDGTVTIDTITGKIDVDTIDEVTNVSDVDSVNLVDTVTSITNTVNVADDIRFTTNIYSSGYQTLEAGLTENDVDELSVSYDATYLDKPGAITIANLSSFYDLNAQVRQVMTVSGSNMRLSTHQFTVPPVAKVRPTTTAYSSCVVYNKTGPTWTDNSTNFDNENGYDAQFPISEVDDAIYFGCKSKFNSISIFIQTAAVLDGTLVWEFWNGSAWVSPTILIDNSNELQSTAGQYYIMLFEGLTNWTKNQPDGASMVNQYWLRLRCSVFNSVTTSPAVRTILIKPVHNNSITSFDLQEIFPTASQTVQILINSTSDIDATHEIVYNVAVGARP